MNSHSISCLVMMLLAVLAANGIAQDGESLDFARDIRPILSNKCFTCHGPDANTREGGFRLDVKSSAFGEADSGEFPIVPGDVSGSAIIRRIHADDDEKMPPDETEKSLTLEDKRILVDWIEAGAPWSEHWAFVAPEKKMPPTVANVDWSINEIDRFVLSKLESQGLVPSAEASRETLIRRLSFDLTGLPPTLEEVDAFLKDRSDDAYERVVDRLLASGHFGEHFASSWLDAARFADTNGYQNDFKRSMWVWRDWVIDAFNENLPYDQFVKQQIAGDLIPDASMKQIIATGFNRNHRTVTEGGSIEEEWHVENLVDRVETTTTVFLGLTMGCARCHDHKFDPISQREFYQFFAFFNSIDEKGFHNEKRGNVPPLLKVPTPEYRANIAGIESSISEYEKSLKQFRSEMDLDELKRGLLTKATGHPQTTEQSWSSFGPENSKSIFGKSHSFTKENHKPVDLGDAFEFEREKPFTVSCWVKCDSFGAIISRMDVENGYRGFDILLNSDGSLSVHLVHKWYQDAIKLTTKTRIKKGQWTNVVVSYDGSSTASGFNVFFSSKIQPFDVNHDGLQSTTKTDHAFLVGLRERTPGFAGQIAKLKIFDSVLDEDSIKDLAASDIAQALSKDSINDSDRSELADLWLLQNNSKYFDVFHNLMTARNELRETKEEIPTVMVMREAKKPRATYVLSRGEYDKPIKDVEIQPGLPAVLPGPKNVGERLGRMDLANWLVDEKNPLTARVAVNRIWSQLFGIGIHKTVEDFGVQSPQPSNQELLDYLAIDFVESGWDTKKLLKKIVTSATYRQNSSAHSGSFGDDPTNQNLARGSRFRLSAEGVRDNALAISGLLTRQIGGRSIKPYQPAGLWDELAGGAGEGKYVMDRDEKLYRRSLYIYRKRTVPHPTMSTFDASSREICQVSRQRTNTPLQALALLNDITYVEAARHLAINARESHDDLSEQIMFAFRSATARRPSEVETNILVDSYRNSLRHFRDDLSAAKQLLKVGQRKVPDDVADAELAALATICSMILNLDETITRE